MIDYRIEPLAGRDRSTFESGSPGLDRYFQEGVNQDIRRHIARCFVAVTNEDEIAGFYTLAATSIAFSVLPQDWVRRLPRYPFVPSALLGRLAVVKTHQGRRLGAALVADAILRATRSDLAAHFLIVDAKDENAALFYEHLAFERLRDGRLIRTV